ncbi:MAG: aldose 1-epimerase, partial [Betaproteobacteria bacterium]
MGGKVTLLLQDADCRVTICPGIGGSIARFTWRGRPILRDAADTALDERAVRQMGCYPLVPYSNRIGNGRLVIGDVTHQLRANTPAEAHALHGFGWQREWQVSAHTANAAELLLHHAPDADWPFACAARQHFRLQDDMLAVRLAVSNTGVAPMPAGLGFHPYFPVEPDTRLQTDWTGMWAMGADSLPTECVAPPPAADFSRSRVIDGWRIDNCFTGWSRRALLDYPTHRVHLSAGAACGQVVCFLPGDGRRF